MALRDRSSSQSALAQHHACAARIELTPKQEESDTTLQSLARTARSPRPRRAGDIRRTGTRVPWFHAIAPACYAVARLSVGGSRDDPNGNRDPLPYVSAWPTDAWPVTRDVATLTPCVIRLTAATARRDGSGSD